MSLAAASLGTLLAAIGTALRLGAAWDAWLLAQVLILLGVSAAGAARWARVAGRA